MGTVVELMSQNITNAQRNIKNWKDVMYNVKDYGAEGDGEVDDTEAFQKVFSAAKAVNGHVVIPLGNYKLSSPLEVEGFTVEGMGRVILSFTGLTSTQDGITIIFDPVRSIIRNIRIDMNNVGRHGLFVGGGDYNTIEDVTVNNAVSDGVHIEPRANFSWIENLYMKNVQANRSGRSGFRIEVPAGRSSIFCNVVTMINCEVRGVGTGGYCVHGLVTADGGSGQKISSLTMIGCEFDAGNAAAAADNIYFERPSGNGGIERIVIIGCTMEDLNSSHPGSCVNGTASYFTLIGNVRFNYANMIPRDLATFNVASGGSDVIRAQGLFGASSSQFQFVGSASDQIDSRPASYLECQTGSNLTLTSIPSIRPGFWRGQELMIVMRTGTSLTLQDETALAGSGVRTIGGSGVTITAGKSVTFRWDENYQAWRQITSVSG